MYDTKQIKCPHLQNSKHEATLYLHPHRYAGIWECPYGYSDTHEHATGENSHYDIEEVTIDYFNPADYYGHGQRTEKVYVCGGAEGCGVTLEGCPEADIAEDMAEMQFEAQYQEV